MFSVVRICNKSEYLVQISNGVKICHKIFLYKDQLYLKIGTCIISFTIMKLNILHLFSSTEKYLNVCFRSCFKYSSFLTKALKISTVSILVIPWRPSFLTSLNWKANYRKKNFKAADLFWPYIYGLLCFLSSIKCRISSRYFPKQTSGKYVNGMTSAKPRRLYWYIC